MPKDQPRFNPALMFTRKMFWSYTKASFSASCRPLSVIDKLHLNTVFHDVIQACTKSKHVELRPSLPEWFDVYKGVERSGFHALATEVKGISAPKRLRSRLLKVQSCVPWLYVFRAS